MVLAQKTGTIIHTQTVPSTGLQNAACSTFSILWKCAVSQKFRVGTQCQDLKTIKGVTGKGRKNIVTNLLKIITQHKQKSD